MDRMLFYIDHNYFLYKHMTHQVHYHHFSRIELNYYTAEHISGGEIKRYVGLKRRKT